MEERPFEPNTLPIALRPGPELFPPEPPLELAKELANPVGLPKVGVNREVVGAEWLVE